jgi:hypothetical protein
MKTLVRKAQVLVSHEQRHKLQNSSETLLKEKEEEEEALQKKAVGSCQVAQKHRSLFKSIYKL